MNDNDFTIEQKEFSNRLAQLRIQKGVSARIMSFELGQNKNYIANIENGKSFPTMASFFNICHYLEISPNEFFNYNNSSPVETNEFVKIISKCSNNQKELLKNLINELK